MNKLNPLTFLVAVMLVVSACTATSNAGQADVASPAGTTSTNAPVEQIANLLHTAAPSPISTATTSSTPVPPTIVITAVKGNVFIRRGPDLAYNAVSVLMDGQSARAVARDVLAKWVQIPIPGHPKDTGWISIQTRFVSVSGDKMKLPEVIPTHWPVQASLRNCTLHYMAAEPGGIIVPPFYRFPDNDVQINPGVYTIHDIEVDGNPEVMEVEVKEGSEIGILDDGDGDHNNCAAP